MYIVRAIPGSCGDIVSAVIDNNGSFLSPHGAILFNSNRRLLKNPQIDLNNISVLLKELELTYKSISCQHYAEAIMTYPNITLVKTIQPKIIPGSIILLDILLVEGLGDTQFLLQ